MLDYATGATFLALAGVGYLLVQLAIYRIPFFQRFSCPRFAHWDVILGTDYSRGINDAMARGERRKWVAETHQKYGMTYQTLDWGKVTYRVADPENMQAVLSTNGDCFGVEALRVPPAGEWLGPGAVMEDGPAWARSRELLKPVFAKGQISDLERFEFHLNRLMNKIPGDGNTFDLQPEFLNLFLDYSTDFLFGESTNTLVDENAHAESREFIKAFDESLMSVYLGGLPWIGRRWQGVKDSDLSKPFKVTHHFVDKWVDAALKRQKVEDKSDRFIFIDELMRQSGSTDKIWIRSQILNVFFPARESSALGLSQLFFSLCRSPRVWAKVREEVAGFKEPLTFSSLKKLPYVSAVVNEGLRLNAPVVDAHRTCTRTCTLPTGGGVNRDKPITIRKGAIVFTSWDPIHRDAKTWGDDAFEFRPERFQERSYKSWEFLPFMRGPRSCPASQMITTQYAYAVARMAQRFERIECRDETKEFVEGWRMNMVSKNGVKMALYKAA